MSLIGLYIWTVLAAVVAAPTLSTLGIHLATRGTAMQTLCVSQAAMVGVLLGVGWFTGSQFELLNTVGPFLMGLGVSGGTFFGMQELTKKHEGSQTTVFLCVFALLVAIANLISAVFPSLENHLAQIYFGDLATLSKLNSQLLLFASLGLAIMLAIFHRPFMAMSFETALFGSLYNTQPNRKTAFLFQTITLATLCLCVQFVGFLFTLVALFLPTLLAKSPERFGLRKHVVTTCVLSTLGTLVGFCLSLEFSNLPTVPTIAITIATLGILRTLALTVIAMRAAQRTEAIPSNQAPPLTPTPSHRHS